MDIYKAKLVFFHGTKNFTKKKKKTQSFQQSFLIYFAQKICRNKN